MGRFSRQILGRCHAVKTIVASAAIASASFVFGACDRPPETPSKPGGSSGADSTSGDRPDFTTRDLDGKTVHLSDYLGKQAVFIDFWGTYCQPCLGMFPHMRRIYAKYKDRGLVVLAISMDPPETMGNVPGYVARNGLRDFVVLYDEDSHVASLLNPKKVEPFVLIYDKRGNLVKTHESFNTGDEILLEAAVKAAVE